MVMGEGYWSGGAAYCEGGYWVFIWDEERRRGGDGGDEDGGRMWVVGGGGDQGSVPE